MVGGEVSLLTKFQSSTVGRNFEHGNFKPLKLYFHRLQPIISQPGDTDNLQSSRLKAQRLASRATDRKVGGSSHPHDQTFTEGKKSFCNFRHRNHEVRSH